jgi:hypothetical protein
MSKDIEPPAIIDDPNAEMRHPLTVLVCLLPLSIFGELYRWIILKRHELLADEVWAEAGKIIGVFAPVIPSLLLVVGCVGWLLISKQKWKLPKLYLIVRILAWSIIWCLVRSVISFTNEGLQADSVKLLGTIGLCISGAVQEEIIFRACAIGFAAWLLSLLGVPMRWGLWIFVPLSAVLFSLAHTHIMNSGITPDSWNSALVVEHIIAGLIYGYIFVRQGLVVATLTHFFFNLLVLSGMLGAL